MTIISSDDQYLLPPVRPNPRKLQSAQASKKPSKKKSRKSAADTRRAEWDKRTAMAHTAEKVREELGCEVGRPSTSELAVADGDKSSLGNKPFKSRLSHRPRRGLSDDTEIGPAKNQPPKKNVKLRNASLTPQSERVKPATARQMTPEELARMS